MRQMSMVGQSESGDTAVKAKKPMIIGSSVLLFPLQWEDKT